MALQSSGAISLNDMHVEAGGTSGTQCTINDADIRGLISKGSGVQMSFNEWYGASNTVTEEFAFHRDYGAPYEDEYYHQTGTTDNYNSTRLELFVVDDILVASRYRDAAQTNNPGYLAQHGAAHAQHAVCDFYTTPDYIDGDSSVWPPTFIKNNCPFPAHSGTVGGWRYFAKRGEFAQQVLFWDSIGLMWFKVHRTTTTTYPY